MRLTIETYILNGDRRSLLWNVVPKRNESETERSGTSNLQFTIYN